MARLKSKGNLTYEYTADELLELFKGDEVELHRSIALRIVTQDREINVTIEPGVTIEIESNAEVEVRATEQSVPAATQATPQSAPASSAPQTPQAPTTASFAQPSAPTVTRQITPETKIVGGAAGASNSDLPPDQQLAAAKARAAQMKQDGERPRPSGRGGMIAGRNR